MCELDVARVCANVEKFNCDYIAGHAPSRRNIEILLVVLNTLPGHEISLANILSVELIGSKCLCQVIQSNTEQYRTVISKTE